MLLAKPNSNVADLLTVTALPELVRERVAEELRGRIIRFGILGFAPFTIISSEGTSGLMKSFAEEFAKALDFSSDFVLLTWGNLERKIYSDREVDVVLGRVHKIASGA